MLPLAMTQKAPTRHSTFIPGNAGDSRCTKWYNRDKPSGLGDFEIAGMSGIPSSDIPCPTSYLVQVLYEGNVFTSPAQIKEWLGQKVYFRTFLGVKKKPGVWCKNSRQESGKCLDYSVRFCCAGKVFSLKECLTYTISCYAGTSKLSVNWHRLVCHNMATHDMKAINGY